MAFTRRLARSAAAIALATAFLALPIVQAAAAIVPVSSRAELGGDATINWDVLGPPGVFSTPPFPRPTAGPIVVSPASSVGELRRVDGGFGFDDDEPLLRLRDGQVDSFLITFNPPLEPRDSDATVRGFGFELQALEPSFSNGDYTGRIVVRDIDDNEIGTVPFASNIAEDPIFVGALSDATDIFQIEILIDWPGGQSPNFDGGFAAINRLDLVTFDPSGGTSVPVPATFALMLAPLAGLALAQMRGTRRRR